MYVVSGGFSQNRACSPAIASNSARCVSRSTAASTGTKSADASRMSIAAGQLPTPSRATLTTVESTMSPVASYTPSSNSVTLRHEVSREPSASQSGAAKCLTTYAVPSMTTRSKSAPDLESTDFSGSRDVAPARSSSSERATDRGATVTSRPDAPWAEYALAERPSAGLPDDVGVRAERVGAVREVWAVVGVTREGHDQQAGPRVDLELVEVREVAVARLAGHEAAEQTLRADVAVVDRLRRDRRLGEVPAAVERRGDVVAPLVLLVVGVVVGRRAEPADRDLIAAESADDRGHDVRLEARGVHADRRGPVHTAVVRDEQPDIGGRLTGLRLAGGDHVDVAGSVGGDAVEDLAEVRTGVGVDQVVAEDGALVAALVSSSDVETVQHGADRRRLQRRLGDLDVDAAGAVGRGLGAERAVRRGVVLPGRARRVEDRAAGHERLAVVVRPLDDRETAGEVVVGEVDRGVLAMLGAQPLPVVLRTLLVRRHAVALVGGSGGVAGGERLAVGGAGADRGPARLRVGDVDGAVRADLDVGVTAARGGADVLCDREGPAAVVAGPETDALGRRRRTAEQPCRPQRVVGDRRNCLRRRHVDVLRVDRVESKRRLAAGVALEHDRPGEDRRSGRGRRRGECRGDRGSGADQAGDQDSGAGTADPRHRGSFRAREPTPG